MFDNVHQYMCHWFFKICCSWCAFVFSLSSIFYILYIWIKVLKFLTVCTWWHWLSHRWKVFSALMERQAMLKLSKFNNEVSFVFLGCWDGSTLVGSIFIIWIADETLQILVLKQKLPDSSRWIPCSLQGRIHAFNLSVSK